MIHANIARVLGWAEEPTDIQEGLYLQPAEAATIENALGASTSSAEELVTANNRVNELTGELETANTSLQAANDRVSTLEAEVEKLKGSASGRGTRLKANAEEGAEESEHAGKLARYDSPDHPVNQAYARMPKKKPTA